MSPPFTTTTSCGQVETFFDEETLKLLNQAGQSGAQALYERIEVYSSQMGIDTYRNFYLFDRQGNLSDRLQ